LQDLITRINQHWHLANSSFRARWRRCARLLGIALASLALLSCSATGTFRAYEGSQRSDLQVAVLEGESYLRQDWLNRYVDSVRFHRVDEIEIQDSDNFERVEVAPGFHDIVVYFYWDLGNQRGLSQALVQYASTRESLSRTLRFNARAGERYTVRAEPVFNDGRRDITTLSHVNFWIEDSRGNIVVDRQAGRYRPQAL
jgi:hypothetical protein